MAKSTIERAKQVIKVLEMGRIPANKLIGLKPDEAAIFNYGRTMPRARDGGEEVVDSNVNGSVGPVFDGIVFGLAVCKALPEDIEKWAELRETQDPGSVKEDLLKDPPTHVIFDGFDRGVVIGSELDEVDQEIDVRFCDIPTMKMRRVAARLLNGDRGWRDTYDLIRDMRTSEKHPETGEEMLKYSDVRISEIMGVTKSAVSKYGNIAHLTEEDWEKLKDEQRSSYVLSLAMKRKQAKNPEEGGSSASDGVKSMTKAQIKQHIDGIDLQISNLGDDDSNREIVFLKGMKFALRHVLRPEGSMCSAAAAAVPGDLGKELKTQIGKIDLLGDLKDHEAEKKKAAQSVGPGKSEKTTNKPGTPKPPSTSVKVKQQGKRTVPKASGKAPSAVKKPNKPKPAKAAKAS